MHPPLGSSADAVRAMPEQAAVVITGLGVVAPPGETAVRAFDALVDGQSGVRALAPELAQPTSLRCAGWMPDFDAAAVVGKKNVRRTARFVQLALAAARQARADAELDAACYAPERVGVIMGSALGGLEAGAQAVGDFDRTGPRSLSPFSLGQCIMNMAPGLVAIESGSRGPCYSTCARWASSAHAIWRGYQALQRGHVDAMLVGGTETMLDPYVLSVLARTGQFGGSQNAESAATASRPFDLESRGAVLAEGAAVLVLERRDAALRRGITLYGELAGFGLCRAAQHARGRGAELAMTDAMHRALAAARIEPAQVGFVSAYGSAVPTSDRAELNALGRVFSEAGATPLISSVKGGSGHMLGASTAFEVAMGALAMLRGVAPPSPNLRSSDPACSRGLDLVAGIARDMDASAALVSAFSESGHYASVVLRRPGREGRPA